MAADERPAERKARILNYLAGSDPLSLLDVTPRRIESLIDDISEANLARRPAPGKWCIREIVSHLADAELVVGYRIRLILASPGSVLLAFDQDAWARAGRYAAGNVSDSLTLFSMLRRTNLRLLRSLTNDEWERSGVHSERGAESLRDIAEYYAGHDINHVWQIEAILRGVGAL
jgi:hypothetical protein